MSCQQARNNVPYSKPHVLQSKRPMHMQVYERAYSLVQIASSSLDSRVFVTKKHRFDIPNANLCTALYSNQIPMNQYTKGLDPKLLHYFRRLSNSGRLRTFQVFNRMLTHWIKRFWLPKQDQLKCIFKQMPIPANPITRIHPYIQSKHYCTLIDWHRLSLWLTSMIPKQFLW